MRYLDELPLERKRIFMRVDFNVPLTEDGQVASDLRIRFSLPSIRYVLNRKGKLILASHLGRPNGRVVPGLSLRPVAATLSRLLGQEVTLAPDCVGPQVQGMAQGLAPGEVLLLENLRFHPEEDANDPAFSQAMARLADIYVNDAFSTTHRAHASVVGITYCLPQVVVGFLLKTELSRLGALLTGPERPFVAIIGGAKVSGKLEAIERLLDKVDSLILGGGMAYTFLRSRGIEVGSSIIEADLIPVAARILSRARDKGIKVFLPVDHLIVPTEEGTQATKGSVAEKIAEGFMGLDIGPRTQEIFCDEIARAKTVFWNGPMGLFEKEACAQGTSSLARAMAEVNGVTIVGGGDTMAAVAGMGLLGRMHHVSTGGGATLDFLAGRTLPGIEALRRRG